MIFEKIEENDRDKILLNGLVELCRVGFLIWALEPDYGNKPPVEPPDYSEKTFCKYWQEFLAKSDLSANVPDIQNPTLSLEATLTLGEEVDKDCYEEWRGEINW